MMMKHWESARARVDGMSLRERAMIFIAAVFVLASALDTLLLEPLLARQKEMSRQMMQQQEQRKALQAQMEALLQARQDDRNSPMRQRIEALKAELKEQDGYLQSRRDRMVESGKMAGLLEQVLTRNGKLQLVAFKTLPVSLWLEKPGGKDAQGAASSGQKQIFKHGVEIKVRGGYLELARYLGELERLPSQMFWGGASLDVDTYPDAILTLTIYTLSWDKTWLTV